MPKEIPHATLSSAGTPVELPIQFSYRPYVPRKRRSVTATANAVVTQTASPKEIVHGDGVLAWTCEACDPEDWNLLLGLYQAEPSPLYEFEGYWGEVLAVYFTTLDQPSVRSRLFDASGQFQVVDVLTGMVADCNLPEEVIE